MWRGLLAAILFLVCGCEDDKTDEAITFGTSADYPPFEYYVDGDVAGFEIDLAKAVAEKLGKKAKFKDMAFSSLLTELQTGSIDAAVSTLNATEERRKSYDFTDSYYSTGVALVYRKESPPSDMSVLKDVKVACQLGSVPEKWLKANRPEANLVSIDNVTQAVEFIKAEHVEGALLDSIIAIEFCKTNPTLEYKVLDENSDDGFAMAVKKGSNLRDSINTAVGELDASGELQALKKKWGLVK
jgi:polar amino acid transport system substrate-binding protein